MNFQHPHGRVNYYVNDQMFENSPNKRDGREKAEKYCLENFIDVNSIIKFDSRTETKRYMYLLQLQKEGKISHLSHHFLFKIRDEEVNAGGETFAVKTYCADFVYLDNTTNERVVEDVKGTAYFITDEFLDTKRDFDMHYKDKGLYIRIMLFNAKDGWFQWRVGDKKKSQTLIKKQREEIKQLRQEKHDREIADRKEEREIARLNELREKETLTKSQEQRKEELENKYKV